ncbi:MAG TPA: hypothetical protein VNS02_07810 [Rhizobiaceae bacterium]|nr:hypothetical protein [Rhizobiaceae bacterium]
MRGIVIAAIAATAILAACSNENQTGPMNGERIKAALEGATWSSSSGASSSYRADGTVTNKGTNGETAEGKWRLDGDRYCQTIPADGTEGCFTLEMQKDGTIRVSNGSILTKAG